MYTVYIYTILANPIHDAVEQRASTGLKELNRFTAADTETQSAYHSTAIVMHRPNKRYARSPRLTL